MILSVSRRTDIPAFYTDWFFNRIKEGYVLTRNPMNIRQVGRINITPDVVDCIVFWTKDPSPMLPRLDELSGYNYYFQFTLNSYGKDIEPMVPCKSTELINTFSELSEKIGPERVVWRYDPILLTPKYTVEYHLEYFEKLSELLKGKFRKCVISFVDIYRKNNSAASEYGIKAPDAAQIEALAAGISETARRGGFTAASCSEKTDLSRYGIEHNCCIDSAIIEQIVGMPLKIKKDKSQREECGCAESIDIGLYNTCIHGCRYCYANYSGKTVAEQHKLYDPDSPLLCSSLNEDDKVYERKVNSLIDGQLHF